VKATFLHANYDKYYWFLAFNLRANHIQGNTSIISANQSVCEYKCNHSVAQNFYFLLSIVNNLTVILPVPGAAGQ